MVAEKGSTINITPRSSAAGLREEIDERARALGMAPRALVTEIYSYSIKNVGDFAEALATPRAAGGLQIGAPVSMDTHRRLKDWAERKRTPLAIHCRYILEKALEEPLYKRIIDELKKRY